jgi:hypothetical protein
MGLTDFWCLKMRVGVTGRGGGLPARFLAPVTRCGGQGCADGLQPSVRPVLVFSAASLRCADRRS